MQSAETLENLQKFLKLLDPSKSRADMLTDVARQLVEMFDVDHSGVMFFSATDTEGEVVAEYPPQGVVGLRASLLNYPLVDQLKVERKPIALFDAQEDPFAGGMRNTFYQETAITLEPGDLLVFYTDGLVERKTEREKLFGFERVGSVLDKFRGQPPDHVLQRLLAAADGFAQGLSVPDDVTLVVV